MVGVRRGRWLAGAVAVLLGLHGTAAVAAAEEPGPAPAEAAPVAAATTPPLLTFAAGVPELSLFRAAVARADWAWQLAGPSPRTVLAPTDDAFRALLAARGLAGLDALRPDQISELLNDHLLDGRYDRAALAAADESASLPQARGGLTLDYERASDTVNGAAVVAYHPVGEDELIVIDQVLVDPDRRPSLWEVILRDPALRGLSIAMNRVGMVPMLNADDGLTVFGPDDAAFSQYLRDAGLPQAVESVEVPALRALLENHLVAGDLDAVDVAGRAGGAATTSVGGMPLRFGAAPLTVNGAAVVRADVQARNGTVHVIDRVLRAEQSAPKPYVVMLDVGPWVDGTDVAAFAAERARVLALAQVPNVARDFPAVPLLEVDVYSPEQLDALRRNPYVRAAMALPDPALAGAAPSCIDGEPTPAVPIDSVALTDARRLHALGITGRNTTVAVIDDLFDLSGGSTCGSHALNVSGIVRQMAPEASVLTYSFAPRVLAGRRVGGLAQAVNDIVSARQQRRNIVAVNMSFAATDDGGRTVSFTPAQCANPDPTDVVRRDIVAWYDQMVATFHAANITLVAAAGNDGATGAMTAPGCIPGIIGVGATYAASYTTTKGFGGGQCADVAPQVRTPACFSNTSTDLDIWAPGVSITAAAPGGGRTFTMSGTSQATPHVSGAVALLRQLAADTPAASARVEVERWLLDLSCSRVSPSSIGHDGVNRPFLDLGNRCIPPPDGAIPAPSFEWRVPDRFGVDANGNGIVDDAAQQGPAFITPSQGWAVDFDACATVVAQGPATYRWSADGVALGEASACAGFRHLFTVQGPHAVTLTVRDGAGREASSTQTVTVKDWLVVGLGDSFASGEGAPDVLIASPQFTAYDRALADWRNAVDRHATALLTLTGAQADLDTVERDGTTASNRLGEVTTAASQVFDAQAKLLAAQAGLAAAVMAPCFGLFTCAAKSNAVSAATAAVGAATLRLTQATTAFSGRVAALTAALVRLGLDLSPVNPFQNPASLTASVLDTSARLIRNGIANLTTLRETARDAAQAAVGVADGLVSSTLATLRTTEAGLTPTWQDRRCHRSTRSAQAMTALALEESDPRRSVTFVDLACSGATIAAGLLGPWVGVEDPGDGTTLPPQVLASKALIGPRTPDAVLLSVGGNDAGFGQIVLNCIAEARCHESGELDPNVRALGAGVCAILVAPVFLPACLAFFGPSPVESAAAVFERQRAALPQQYAALADRLNSTFGPGVPVYVTGYPNPTRDDQGAVCRFDPADPARALPGLSPEEGQWVDAYVLPTLNAAVQAAATAHGWRYVEPPAQATTHGYCAADHWFVRVQDSLFGQGNLNGVMHPNAAGYGAMAAVLTARLATDLG